MSSFKEFLKPIVPEKLFSILIATDGFKVHSRGKEIKFEQAGSDPAKGTIRYKEIGGSIEAEYSVELNPDYKTAKCKLKLFNSGKSAAGPIDLACPLHFLFKRAPAGGSAVPWRTLTTSGGTHEMIYPPLAYRTEERILFKDYLRIESDEWGRSSNKNIPLLIAACGADGDAPGFFCGMEWSGHWAIELEMKSEVSLLGGPKVNGLILEPGETLSLPAVHMGFFEGGLDEGTNALRRYIHKCVAAKYEGEPVTPPVSYDHWFGIGGGFNEELLRRQADRAAETGIEFFVVDTAWFAGDFPLGNGNWDRVDSNKFPRGIKPLAEYVRSKGMKFGLWFELERASAGTDAAVQHPQWFIDIPSLIPPRELNFHNTPQLHLDLSLPGAQNWAIGTIGKYVEELDICWIRWDYNITPGPYWNKVDPTGKTQFAYMDGLYRVLDTLMQKYPHLFIECCASGGRRLDLGTAKRAHACWFSDQTKFEHMCRYMQARFNRFWPGNFANSAVVAERGEGDTSFSVQAVLSRMCGSLSFDGDIASWSAANTKKASGLVEVYKKIRHLLVQDFYQLSPVPASDRDWDVFQFSSYDNNEGVIFAFRYAGEDLSMQVRPKALDGSSVYRVENMAEKSGSNLSGADLLSKGIKIELDQNSAVLLHYKKQRR